MEEKCKWICAYLERKFKNCQNFLWSVTYAIRTCKNLTNCISEVIITTNILGENCFVTFFKESFESKIKNKKKVLELS